MFKKLIAGLVLTVCLTTIAGISISQDKAYVGSSKSTKYHYTWCRWAQKINPGNRVVFSSAKEALSSGYIPCKVCKPPIKD